MIPKAIFISRSTDQIGDQLRIYEAGGGTLYAQPLISFEGIESAHSSTQDVVFFSSIRAATYFFQFHPKPSSLFACAGAETARKLEEQFQLKCAFVSEEAGNPSKSALEFKQWLKDRTVLFPMSEQSLHTYASLIPAKQKTELPVYRTLLHAVLIPACDYYVFSSPSNFNAFLKENVLPEHARCIAWGQSTKAAILEKGIPVHYCLKDGSISELDVYFEQHVFNRPTHEI